MQFLEKHPEAQKITYDNKAEVQAEEEKGNVIRYGDAVEILVFELLKEGERSSKDQLKT